MKKFTTQKALAAAFACAAALSLAACGKSDDASENATADNVEMPADELPTGEPSAAAAPADAAAPAADASAAAMSAEDAAKSAADNAATAADAAKAAAAAAAAEAEKKM